MKEVKYLLIKVEIKDKYNNIKNTIKNTRAVKCDVKRQTEAGNYKF